MENIKFIRDIMRSSTNKGKEIGNTLYFQFDNGNRAKVYAVEDGVRAEIVNRTEGAVDKAFFPFANYFDPVQCSPGAPKWTQCIDRGKWRFSHYPHCLPKTTDYRRLSAAVDEYMEMFE